MKRYYLEYRYEVIAALSGGAVMVLELVGARMMAPYFGTSIYVWTAMIGVILGALSLGYYYGGQLADKSASDRGLMSILAIAAGVLLISNLVQAELLQLVARTAIDIRFQALTGALLLFAPPAVLLGLISPYVAKLKLSSLRTAGRSIGQLYAAGTLGSILGTFLAGYFLIAWFGNYDLGLGLVVLLIGTSFLAQRQEWRGWRMATAGLAVGLMVLPMPPSSPIVADIDTAYSRYQVSETVTEGGTLRELLVDHNSIQSAHYVGQPNHLPLGYTREFKQLWDQFQPEHSLVIGGGAFTFPSYIARQAPTAQVDVVEIDPALEGIARQYFGYQERSNLRLVFEDGRVFLNQAPVDRYDLIFLDAFSALTPPYQLTTHQAMAAAKRATTEGGVVVANVVGVPEGGRFFAAMITTYRSVFDHVRAYPVRPMLPATSKQNLIVTMTDHKAAQRVIDEGFGKALPFPDNGQLLSDDYAPVEQLIAH